MDAAGKPQQSNGRARWRLARIAGINFALLLLLLEAAGRIYQHYTLHKRGSPWASGELSRYLGYVNHSRDLDYASKSQSLKPANSGQNSAYIYSCYSSCTSLHNRPAVVLQGDSWAELLERNSAGTLFAPFVQASWVSIGAGTTSFSPSNYAAQLVYLKHRVGINPRLVIAFIDQTDIGDDYFRYKSQLRPARDRDIAFRRVEPFGPFLHAAYFNFSHIPRQSSFQQQPASFWLLENAVGRALKKNDEASDWSLGLSRTPSWSVISSPLRGQAPAASRYFSTTLNHYIDTAQRLGVRELVLVSHPHRKHLEQGPKAYSTDVGDLINRVLHERPQPAGAAFHVKAIRLATAPRRCNDTACDAYFVPGDWASHPRDNQFDRIAKAILQSMGTRSQLPAAH